MRFWPRKKVETKAAASLSPATDRGWYTIFESFAGAFQQDVKINRDDVLSNPIVYACISLISGDIGKLRLKLVEMGASGVWEEVRADSPFRPVLRKPNRYQTRQQFFEQWITSKLIFGNAYVLKQRDARGIVTALYVLDPQRVTPLIAPDGAVYYQLQDDHLAQVQSLIPAAPASEVIHDRQDCLFHPLIGVSPLFACGLAATQGLNIQRYSARFFGNGARPGGVLTAPGMISDETAKRLKEYWDTKFSGENAGKIAVLGDGMKYEQMTATAIDSQQAEQNKAASEQICSAFHVPAYKVGVGPIPTYSNAEVLNQIYYSDCIQKLAEAIEGLLDEGLGLTTVVGKTYGVEFELDDLMRMDMKSRVEAAEKAIGSGAMAPNEARARWLSLPPTQGGGAPYLQVQNYSLAALAERDSDKPFSKPVQPAAPAEPESDDEEIERVADALLRKELADAQYA